MTADAPRTVRRRFALVALVLPALVVAASLAGQLALLPAAPATVATHWGWTGAADGFGPAWSVPLVTVLLGLGLPALIFAMSAGALRRGDHGATYRVLGGVALGTAVLAGGLGVALLAVQAGSADPARSTLPVLLVPAMLGAASAAGLLGWAVQPHVPWRPTPAAATPVVPVRPGERVVWMQRAALARPGRLALSVVVGVAVILTVILALTGERAATWIAVVVTVVLGASVLANSRFHVRVDPDGLLVTSAAGWPRVHVPLAEIAAAEVVEVAPMAEFGGWGLRWGPDRRFGVVLRAGEGILVRRRDGRSLTVTVDDAATGAGLLSAYAALTAAPRRD